jgi:putative ABC transport system permease protein
LRHLPGVVTVEPFRYAFVRLSHEQQRRQLIIQGIPPNGLHNRVLGPSSHRIQLPSAGLVVSRKLAETLQAKVGDALVVEVLEGKRPTRSVPLVGLAEDFAGMAAYMDIHAVNRLLGEGDIITGANFRVDAAHRSEFLRALKGLPKLSSVAIKESLRENFRQTTAASIGLIQRIYSVFALGTGFAKVILQSINTETVRLPLVLTAENYTSAVLVVVIASILSALVVLRKLHQLDLVGALKAPE